MHPEWQWREMLGQVFQLNSCQHLVQMHRPYINWSDVYYPQIVLCQKHVHWCSCDGVPVRRSFQCYSSFMSALCRYIFIYSAPLSSLTYSLQFTLCQVFHSGSTWWLQIYRQLSRANLKNKKDDKNCMSWNMHYHHLFLNTFLLES